MNKDKALEKSYYIDRSKVPGYRKEALVKESELTRDDIIYLWNKLVEHFNDSPVQMQIEFARQLHDTYKKKIDEMIKTTQDENIGPQGEHAEKSEVPADITDTPTYNPVN